MPSGTALRVIEGGQAESKPAHPAAVEFARKLARLQLSAMMHGRGTQPRK